MKSTTTIAGVCQGIRDLAEAAERFANASQYDARDETSRVAVALAEYLVPKNDERREKRETG